MNQIIMRREYYTLEELRFRDKYLNNSEMWVCRGEAYRSYKKEEESRNEKLLKHLRNSNREDSSDDHQSSSSSSSSSSAYSILSSSSSDTGSENFNEWRY